MRAVADGGRHATGEAPQAVAGGRCLRSRGSAGSRRVVRVVARAVRTGRTAPSRSDDTGGPGATTRGTRPCEGALP